MQVHAIRYYILTLIILLAAVVRIYFYMGHVFSDDAYYTWLAYVNLNPSEAYTGYPVFILRTGFTWLISFAFLIFGSAEFSSVIFPFIFSLLSIPLVYFLTAQFTDITGIKLSSAFLMALFPTDVIFATIAFPDLINSFFISLSIYLLLLAYKKSDWRLSLLSGSSLALSFLFKENGVYIAVLLFILFVWLFFRNRSSSHIVIIPLLVLLFFFLIEGIYYSLINNDFFFRLHQTELNYKYSFYDFFPHTVYKHFGSDISYLQSVLLQLLLNLKSVFLRRFYLFIPLIALVQLLINLRNRQHKLLTFWFAALAVIYLGFTTSLSEYKPLDLQRSWYIYPMLFPSVILTAFFIYNLRRRFIIPAIIIYTAASFILCSSYRTFFDAENLTSLKKFISAESPTVHTSHFNMYSIELLNEYSGLTSDEINLTNLPPGEYVLYNPKHIEELKLQGHTFPSFSPLFNPPFRLEHRFGDYYLYRKH